MTEVKLHEPVAQSAAHCRRLWGVLGTAAEPVVHYCCTDTVEVLIPMPTNRDPGHPHKPTDPHTLERQHVELAPTHRCVCGATTGEEGARLICRYRELGTPACGRLITSVEQTPLGEVSMPCGHPVRMLGKPGATDRRNRRGAYGRIVNGDQKRQR